MSRMPRIRRWLNVPAGPAQNPWQPAAPSSANWGKGSPSADMCSAVGWLSFRRIADIPFDACLAALESWQRTGQDTELHVRQGLLRGPIEADRQSGTCRIQVRLARRPLRRPLLMRLDIDRWSSSQTALELIPYKRARPTAGYFRAGHHLLDSLTHSLQAWATSAPKTTSARPRPADVPQPQGAPGPLPPGPPQVATNAAAQAAPACPPRRTAALPHTGDGVGQSQRGTVRHDQAAPAPPGATSGRNGTTGCRASHDCRRAQISQTRAYRGGVCTHQSAAQSGGYSHAGQRGPGPVGSLATPASTRRSARPVCINIHRRGAPTRRFCPPRARVGGRRPCRVAGVRQRGSGGLQDICGSRYPCGEPSCPSAGGPAQNTVAKPASVSRRSTSSGDSQ